MQKRSSSSSSQVTSTAVPSGGTRSSTPIRKKLRKFEAGQLYHSDFWLYEISHYGKINTFIGLDEPLGASRWKQHGFDFIFLKEIELKLVRHNRGLTKLVQVLLQGVPEKSEQPTILDSPMTIGVYRRLLAGSWQVSL